MIMNDIENCNRACNALLLLLLFNGRDVSTFLEIAFI